MKDARRVTAERTKRGFLRELYSGHDRGAIARLDGVDRMHELQKDSEAGEDCPLMIAAKRAAAMCGKSLRTWRTWDSAGLIPQPVRIGRSTLWRVDELKAWVAAGCPRRAEWEARQ